MCRKQRVGLGSVLIAATIGVAELSSGVAMGQSADTYDIVVYGGTAGGVAAAVQAARMGMHVALISPSDHLGGMTTGGLSYTDAGNWPDAIGGVAGEFYRRTGRAYGEASSEYHFEPHVAESVLNQMINEAAVTVISGSSQTLAAGGVAKNGSQIRSITTEGGRTISAKQFIDASYTGDLLAAAGISYAVGRESNATYGETYNGVEKRYSMNHQFGVRVDPYVKAGDPSSGLLPGISSVTPGADGTGDSRIQAYNYRLIVTKNTSNMLPWTKPANYDASQYALLARYVQTAGITQVSSLFLLNGIKGGKYDLNNKGPISTDFIGGNYAYPDADHATREQIAQAHKDYQQGLMYFLASDPSIPQALRSDMNSYGLCKDEFTDNGGWSSELYIREGRRMVGQYVMIDKNVLGSRTVADSIGLGTYTMDSHNAERYVAYDSTTGQAYVMNEGNIEIGISKPYGISYQSITPQQAQASNLLVPTAMSASHIAYGSIRMEPVFMELGQSAATAAVQAIQNGQAVQQVDYNALAKQLTLDGQKLTYGTSTTTPRFTGTLREDFNYGGADNRVDIVSYTSGGWSEPWGAGKSSTDGSVQLSSAAGYAQRNQLRYNAPEYTNLADPTYILSGGAGAVPGTTGAGTVVGRGITGGMTGTIWISALAEIDSLTGANRDALIWLDRNSSGNVDNAGNAFIGLRTGGIAKLRTAGVNDLSDGAHTFAADAVHLLLARVDIDPNGGAADSLQFWVDPDLMNLGSPNLSVSGSDLFGSSFDGLGLSVGAGGGMIDAIRISNSADGFVQVTAVPEPTALSLVALGGAMLLRRRSCI